jgi:hypothetical protein
MGGYSYFGEKKVSKHYDIAISWITTAFEFVPFVTILTLYYVILTSRWKRSKFGTLFLIQITTSLTYYVSNSLYINFEVPPILFWLCHLFFNSTLALTMHCHLQMAKMIALRGASMTEGTVRILEILLPVSYVMITGGVFGILPTLGKDPNAFIYVWYEIIGKSLWMLFYMIFESFLHTYMCFVLHKINIHQQELFLRGHPDIQQDMLSHWVVGYKSMIAALVTWVIYLWTGSLAFIAMNFFPPKDMDIYTRDCIREILVSMSSLQFVFFFWLISSFQKYRFNVPDSVFIVSDRGERTLKTAMIQDVATEFVENRQLQRKEARSTMATEGVRSTVRY